MNDIEKEMIKLELEKPWDKDLANINKIKKLYEISIVLTNHSKKSRDLRFFNTALKINDLIMDNKNIFSHEEIIKLEELEKKMIDWIKEITL